MSSTDPVLERFARLPITVQRSIETALVGSGPIGAGSTLDHVHRARLASLVEASEKDLAARDPGMVPEIRANRPATLAQDRRSQGGAMPGHPRVSSAAGATHAATAAVQAAVLAERERLLREGAGPKPNHDVGLPADFDEALAVAVDHAQAARDAGASEEKVRTILGTYTRMLWRRESVRSEFADIRELDALADYRLRGGTKRRS